MDRLRRVEVFVAVAQAESFTGGARNVGLSAPSATRAINELEAHLGAKLFARTTRAVRLTEEGRRYLDDCRGILEELRAADAAVTGAYGAPAGKLRITAPVEFGHRYIAPILPLFVQEHADVQIETLFTDRIVSIVDEGYEVALRIGNLPDSNLTARRVGRVRRVVCASRDYLASCDVPNEPHDLKKHPIVVAKNVTPTSEWTFRDHHPVRLKPQITVNTVAAAIAAIKSGWGVTCLLSYQVGDELVAGSVKTLLEDHEPKPLPVHLVYHGGRRAAAKTRAFVDFATDRLKSIPILS